MTTQSNARSSKRRVAVKFENLTPELQEVFKEKYPKGYTDYMVDLFKVDKPDGTYFYAVSLETDDSIYLVKMNVRVDDYEDAEKDLFDDDDSDEPTEDSFPDDATDVVDEDEN